METTTIIHKKADFKILKQPSGGGRIELYEKYIDDHNRLRRAADQSVANCGKQVVGGGFNPNSAEELVEVLGEISK